MTTPAIGTSVRFKQSWDIFSCDTLIEEGSVGNVIGYENGTQLLGVKMLEHYPGLDEWENVVWLDSEIGDHVDYIEAIAA
jgi:hypothetical protein